MLTKKGDYEPLEKQLAGFMRVLAHLARMAIMIRLAQTQKYVDGNVIDDLPLEEASAFQHLKALEKAGLIKGTTMTIRSNYCINWDAFWAFSDNSIANGLSSQIIQKAGDSYAAQVVRRVPGITVVDNRFINVCGLLERYNSIQLNNVVAPSLETDIRSFSFDLIPSSAVNQLVAGYINLILPYKDKFTLVAGVRA